MRRNYGGSNHKLVVVMRLDFHFWSDSVYDPEGGAEHILKVKILASEEPSRQGILNGWEESIKIAEDKLKLSLNEEDEANLIVSEDFNDVDYAYSQDVLTWIWDGVFKTSGDHNYFDGFVVAWKDMKIALKNSAIHGDWNFNRKQKQWWCEENLERK